jgi:hypothetical protein
LATNAGGGGEATSVLTTHHPYPQGGLP